VGQDEEPFTEVRCADFLRREYSRRSSVAHLFQSWEDGPVDVPVNRLVCHARYVLEEAPFGADLSDEPEGVGPEVPVVVLAPALASGREGLTGNPANDASHASTEASGVESAKVGPNRRAIQGAVFHARRQDCGRRELSLHVQDAARAWQSASDGEVEAADA
jgi:hypothetical protein